MRSCIMHKCVHCYTLQKSCEHICTCNLHFSPVFHKELSKMFCQDARCLALQEKARLKIEKDEQEAPYKYAVVDGRKELVCCLLAVSIPLCIVQCIHACLQCPSQEPGCCQQSNV